MMSGEHSRRGSIQGICRLRSRVTKPQYIQRDYGIQIKADGSNPAMGQYSSLFSWTSSVSSYLLFEGHALHRLMRVIIVKSVEQM